MPTQNVQVTFTSRPPALASLETRPPIPAPPPIPGLGAAMPNLGRETPGLTLEEKEHAVHQHRNWVRVTHACNLKCVFCFDADVQYAYHRPFEEVADEIERGFHGPRDRLILSGGEATTSPHFLKLVEYGKKLGYERVQVITNGNMFVYKDFTRAAMDVGLGETTFSMHGHNSRLHDAMVGTKGAFVQALRGLMNVLEDGRAIVNIDVCINGMNYRQLAEIIRFYERLGVHEFDLLQVIPFGRAWANRKKTMYDIEEAFEPLNAAFRESRKPGTVIWTNRFPVHYLEGVEDLIQDPHKFYDEVRGRFHQYDRYFRHEEMLFCEGDRCNHCFLDKFCHRLFRMWDGHKVHRQRRFLIDLADDDRGADRVLALFRKLVLAKLPDGVGPRFLTVRAATPGEVLRAVDCVRERLAGSSASLVPPAAAQAPRGDMTPADAVSTAISAGSDTPSAPLTVPPEPRFPVRFHAADSETLAALLEAPKLDPAFARITHLQVEPRDPKTLLRIVKGAARLPLTRLEIAVVKPTQEVLARLKDTLERMGNVTLYLPTYEIYAEAQRLLPDLPAFKAALGELRTIRTRGIPACLSPAIAENPGATACEPIENRDHELPVNALQADGIFDIYRYTRYDVNERYMSHSKRCDGCIHRAVCPGLHIQAVRTLGYGILQPVVAPGMKAVELAPGEEAVALNYDAMVRQEAPPDDVLGEEMSVDFVR